MIPISLYFSITVLSSKGISFISCLIIFMLKIFKSLFHREYVGQLPKDATIKIDKEKIFIFEITNLTLEHKKWFYEKKNKMCWFC